MSEPRAYYLALDLDDWAEDIDLDWKEVTKEQYMRAERAAGFRSKFGPGHIATAGFSGSGVRGKVSY